MKHAILEAIFPTTQYKNDYDNRKGIYPKGTRVMNSAMSIVYINKRIVLAIFCRKSTLTSSIN